MGLHGYIEKLRTKPVRERERIAVIATAIGFFFILLIWIASFKEMNRSVEQPAGQASQKLDDLKTDFQTDKDSIQNMVQQLPAETGQQDKTEPDSISPAPSDKNDSLDMGNSAQAPSEGSQDSGNESNPGMPPLP